MSLLISVAGLDLILHEKFENIQIFLHVDVFSCHKKNPLKQVKIKLNKIWWPPIKY